MEEFLLSNNRVQTPSSDADDSNISLLPSPGWSRSPTFPAIHRIKSEALVFFSAAATAAATVSTPRLAPCSSFPEKSRFKDQIISRRIRSYSAPSLLNPSPSKSATTGSPIPVHNISQPEPVSDPLLPSQTTPSIVKHAIFGVILYIVTGVMAYILMRGSFKCEGTSRLVDALYFSVVTLCTIGYGDIVPITTSAKIFTCVFILVGFGVIDIYLNGLVTYMLDRQEAILLTAMEEEGDNRMLFKTYVMDMKKGRMRIRMKVFLAMGVVVSCVGIGMIMIHLFEGLDWGDSFYLSVTSVTTVGYGDYAFKTMEGRCFAIVWLLVSTLAVARAFMYLAELRIDRRNRNKIANWVDQQKKMANASSLALGYDLVAAHLYCDGSLSKSEYVVYKLKEMGKIVEKDILQICNQFDHLDTGNCGKITLADLMEGHR